jgi:hypothetical protein
MNEAWAEKKRLVWQRAHGICEKCQIAKGAHVHHLRYAQRRGHEKLEWLQLVCLKCHGEYHPHHTFLTLAQQAQRAEARRQRAKARANVCRHCGGTYPKAKHKAICVAFGLDR